MAYDEDLAERIRELLAGRSDVTEKKMFGGLAFLVGGSMAVAVSGSGGLMLRVEPGTAADVRRRAHVGPMVMRGKELDGWVRVEPAGCRTAPQLRRWVDTGVAAAGGA